MTWKRISGFKKPKKKKEKILIKKKLLDFRIKRFQSQISLLDDEEYYRTEEYFNVLLNNLRILISLSKPAKKNIKRINKISKDSKDILDIVRTRSGGDTKATKIMKKIIAYGDNL